MLRILLFSFVALSLSTSFAEGDFVCRVMSPSEEITIKGAYYPELYDMAAGAELTEPITISDSKGTVITSIAPEDAWLNFLDRPFQHENGIELRLYKGGEAAFKLNYTWYYLEKQVVASSQGRIPGTEIDIDTKRVHCDF